MATIALLSHHSSNPLENHSSDSKNGFDPFPVLTQGTRHGGMTSSEDPINGYNKPEVQQFHNQISTLFPGMLESAKTAKPKVQHMVSLEYDEMASEDELELSRTFRNEDDEEEVEDETMFEDDYENDEEDEEERSILQKSPEERQEIMDEIAELEEKVPQLSTDYQLIDRLGTGTFSSVYKAIDLGYHDKWDNSVWHGSHPASSSAHYQSVPHSQGSKVFVAIKRIYVTSNPERIRNEISIMEDCRGCRHVSQLMTAFRKEDQVVAIMPYHRNEDFRDFYLDLPIEGIKAYFRCMFRALRDVHARAIIHRDVKPANFLFDPRTGIGTLCDFGLACRMEASSSAGTCLHTEPKRDYPHGRTRQKGQYDPELLKRIQREAKLKSTMPSDRVGYPEKDTRPISKANRAGTRGFRAPEVLLKCGSQSGAIDVWSTGIILLFFLTGKFPLFASNDDTEALVEIATIIGKRKMERTALLHCRTFSTNVPSITADGMSWRDFILKQNPDLVKPRKPDPRFYPYSQTMKKRSPTLPPSSISSLEDEHPTHSPSPFADDLSGPSAEKHAQDLEDVFDFIEKIMHPEATRRLTPRGALYHPFLAETAETAAVNGYEQPMEDDELVPHPFGEGVCGTLHQMDETDDMFVILPMPDGEKMVRKVDAGEAIAIGREPCELHREWYYECLGKGLIP